MQTGKILTTAEVKEIIAKHFGVTADKIISSKGKIIIKPCKMTITRERRKLRNLKNRMNDNLIKQAEIEAQYKSWRGNITKYNCYKSVKNTDAL